jgi:hypothetical protein
MSQSRETRDHQHEEQQPKGKASSYPANFRHRPSRPRPNVPGWGADLDHKNRPAHPMERTPPRLDGLHWTEPEQQPVHQEIFHSTERPGLTPVFGTGQPPRGVSGRLRALAYRQSENDLRRWLLLLLADRFDVVEGVGQDLAHGHVPNVYAETGGPAAWKHDPGGVVRKVAIAAALTGLTVYCLSRRRPT